MLKIRAELECTVEGKSGRFILDHDCPIQTAKEMIFQFQRMLFEVEDTAKKQLEAQKAAEKLAEPEVTEESKIESIG